MDKRKKFMFKTALMVSSMTAVCVTTMVTPILGNIQETYSGLSTSIVNLVSTLPALMSILGMIFSGRLSATVSKRKVLFAGFLLFTIAGVGTTFMSAFPLLLLARCLTGFGAGICTPVVGAIVSDFFEAGERDAVMGRNNAFDSICSIIFAALAGGLGAMNWRYSFLLYGVGIIAIVMQLTCMPEIKADTVVAQKEKKEKTKLEAAVKMALIGFAACSFFLGFFGNAFMVGLSRFVLEEGIGDSMTAGLATAAMGVFSLLCSIFFAKINGLFKKYMMAVIYLLNIICFGILAIAHNVPMVVIAAVPLGMSIGLMMPFFMSSAARIAPIAQRTLIIGIIMGCLQLGQFCGGFLQQFVSTVSGHSETRFMFRFVTVAFIIVFIILLIKAIATKKEQEPTIPAQGIQG